MTLADRSRSRMAMAAPCSAGIRAVAPPIPRGEAPHVTITVPPSSSTRPLPLARPAAAAPRPDVRDEDKGPTS